MVYSTVILLACLIVLRCPVEMWGYSNTFQVVRVGSWVSENPSYPDNVLYCHCTVSFPGTIRNS